MADGACSSLGIVCSGGVKLITSVICIDRLIEFAVTVGPALLLLFCRVGTVNGKDACRGLIVGELVWANLKSVVLVESVYPRDYYRNV